MKALLPTHKQFSPVQTIESSVTVWDTPFTVVSNGIVYRPASATDSFGVGVDLNTLSSAALHTHFDNNSIVGLSVDNAEVEGRVPLIHDYWGTGAPLGVSQSNRAALRYSGYVKTTGNYGLLFTGRGRVRVFKNGTAVLTAKITEDNPGLVNYQTFTAGDTVEIFFWALNEPWAGISARVFTDASAAPDAASIDWNKMRESSVLAASWMDDNEAVATEVLSDVSSVTVKFEEGGVPEATVELVLASNNSYSGWSFDPSDNSITHNGTGFVISERRRISISGGYNGVTSEEFTGIIIDVIPKEEGITLTCRGFEELLAQTISENYPDRTSYASFGYTDRQGISNPVWRVPAYDHWPYEYAIKDLCARAWIDPSMLQGKQQLVRYGESVAEDGASLFRCRTLSGNLIRIPRQAHYGNLDGDPDRPADDPYIETSELTASLYVRATTMLDRIGYTFRTNSSGYLMLRAVNNPVAVAPLIELDNLGESGRAWVGGNDMFIPFSRSYRDPVVVVTPVTGQSTNRGTAGAQYPSIKSITPFGFTVAQMESSATGGDSIVTETYVNYIVIEKGVHETPGGLTIEAGRSTATGAAYSTISFSSAFPSAPSVVATPQDFPAVASHRCRIGTVTTANFQIQIERGNEAAPLGISQPVGWVAIEKGTDSTVGIAAGTLASVTEEFDKTGTGLTYDQVPSIVVALGSEIDAIPAYAVVGKQGNNPFTVAIEEPNSEDQSHSAETVHWISLPTDRVISAGSVHPSASGGSYLTKTGTGWTVSATDIRASRIDIVLGRGPNTGSIDVSITRQEGGFTDSVTIDTSHESETFYYDNVYDSDLRNICSVSILTGQYYGIYDVTITPSVGTTTEDFYLDCLRVFEQDPSTPHPEFQLRTFNNAIKTEADFNSNDTVNDAIVTGQRLSATSGVGDAQESPDTEFIVSRAQDLHAILNPSASNYVGSKITAFLSDEKVVSQELADWAARSLVSRYRTPRPDASINHTALHTIELSDPIYVKDDGFDLFDGTVVMWVNSYTTTYDFSSDPKATTNISATPFSAVPSFEPREEVDIRRFGNKPVINLDISYTGVNGTTQSNLGPDETVAVDESVDRVHNKQAVQNDGSDFLTITADTISPGTESVHFGQDLASLDTTLTVQFRNNPYYKFYEQSGTRINLVFEGGDGSLNYASSSWGVGTGQFRDYANFNYVKITDKYSNNSPFYDPYSSDLNPPKLVNVSFDALVSGYYRVSVVDARDISNPITVAWLTEPNNTDSDGNKHWQYLEAGNEKVFKWGGEDTIGDWNRKHSQSLSWRMRGAFSEISDRFTLGSGYFAQNDSTSPRTHISGEVNAGIPAYNVGQYAQFYIRVECIREDRAETLRVESNKTEDLRDNTGALLTDRYIYYHLPEPNKVTISIQDWDYATEGAYDPLNPGDSWTTPDTDTTFRDEKPVKVTITPVARKGVLYEDSVANSHFKLNRVVHLTALNMDTSTIFTGLPWNGESSTQEKRVLSRRTSNDEHTLIFKDESYRNIETTSSWVFYPSLFEKDFGDGPTSIEYMNYLQLFDVPQWNPQRHSGEARSRFLMGYLSYLFYFSVFTQDRSGRMVWAIDPTHVDKSKVTTNTDPMEFPWDLDRHQRRVIYTRQWWDSDLLDDILSPYAVGDTYKGLYADRMDPRDITATRNLYRKNSGSTVTGSLSTGHQDVISYLSREYLPADYNFNTQFGAYDPATENTSTVLGSWTWESDSFLWVPAPGRDFHPFYRVPPMTLAGRRWTNNGRSIAWFSSFYVWASPVYFIDGSFYAQQRDEALYDTWFGKIRHLPNNYNAVSPFEIMDNFTTLPGVDVNTYFSDRDGDENSIASYIGQFQKTDDMNCYETSRGGVSHGTYPARSPIISIGGDPYYLNAFIYRHFKTSDEIWKLYNDVYEKGWFSLTYRHTYVWESASMFPCRFTYTDLPGFRLDMTSIDHDVANLYQSPEFYDAGGWAGWKDDHPSSLQASGAFADTGTCNELHWRDDINDEAGGACTIDNPLIALVNEENHNPDYTVDKNIFFNHRYTFAVGPRLPETRRVILALNLVNERRTVPL